MNLLVTPPTYEQSANRRTASFLIAALLLTIGTIQITNAARFASGDNGSDLDRQWVVEQYVNQHIDPYPVAFDALAARYGLMAPRGPLHLKEFKIFDIPPSGPNLRTIPVLGPPTATYPPTSLMMMRPILLLPRGIAREVWLLLNIALLFLVSWELFVLIRARGLAPLLLIAGVVAAWPASSSCIGRGQFSLLCFWCILLAIRLQRRFPIVAGLLFGLSLMKPSLAIPFLFIPLLDRRLKTLAAIAISQAVLLGLAGWWFHASPLNLVKEWLSVAAYFRQGMYTVQDIINALRLDGSWADLGLQLGVVAAAGILSARLPFEKRLSLLAVAACIWTYHSDYDFVVLLVPAALLTVQPFDIWWTADFSLLALIGIGLSQPIYAGTALIARAIRWTVRLSLVLLASVQVLAPGMSEPVETAEPDPVFSAR